MIIIEIINGGEVKIHDSKIGTITNAPTYDWHLTNLRNYVNLKPEAASSKELEGGFKVAPMGYGSGFLGLPGDFTSPSRFVRATAFSSSAPLMSDAYTAVNQAFVILSNFNVPIGSMFPADRVPNIPATTQWTSVSDLSNLNFYYTTYYNRQIRRVNLKKINFSRVKLTILALDKIENQNIEDLSFR